MQFSQVLDYLIVGIPFMFCALFVIDFTNGLFAVWDSVAPSITVAEAIVAPVLPEVQAPEICVIAPAIEPEVTALVPVQVEKRKRGRPKKQVLPANKTVIRHRGKSKRD